MRLRVGDHLVVRRGFYSHHGILVSPNEVIHFFSSLKIKLKGMAKVCECALEDFCEGAECEVVRYSHCSKPATVKRRARSLLNRGGYCLLTNNCEHLARHCKTGRKISYQVRRFAQGMQVGARVALLVAKKVRTLAVLAGAVSLGALAGGVILYSLHHWFGI